MVLTGLRFYRARLARFVHDSNSGELAALFPQSRVDRGNAPWNKRASWRLGRDKGLKPLVPYRRIPGFLSHILSDTVPPAGDSNSYTPHGWATSA